ncbi:uncharacterized protein DC041_0011195 [Schistosoma bovis]|uniref:Uncharacterized protein n=1 Tax=Schistosoma bovis TaxID=6184 RepID=A0A430QQ71_SCHBO|nr:uncharacterized protein DC041_0011195 [Schistosoma bovis]
MHQINYNRDIEKAKIDSIEIIKKEYKAKQFHENFLLKQCFTRWSCTIRMEKSTRDQLEKESFRREKEIEFLNHLDTLMNNHQTKTLTSDNDNNTTNNNNNSNNNNNNQDNETIPLGNRICLTDRKSQKSKTVNTNKACLKSANSSPSVEDLISGDFTLDHYKSDKKNNEADKSSSEMNEPLVNVENGTDDQVHSQLIIISFTLLEMEERAAERARRRALQEERRRENEQKKKSIITVY